MKRISVDFVVSDALYSELEHISEQLGVGHSTESLFAAIMQIGSEQRVRDGMETLHRLSLHQRERLALNLSEL